MRDNRAARGAVTARSRRRLSRFGDYLFLAPAVLLVGGLLLGSVVFTTAISFTEWDLIGPVEPVGLDQYARIASDPTIRQSMINTVAWVVGSLALPVLGGLLVAVFVDALPLQGLWKMVIYLPVVLAPTVSSVIWKEIVAFDGPLNAVIQAFGLPHPGFAWLSEPYLNTAVMIVTSTWRALGPAMVMFLIGLQTIPRETIEAAMLDGANRWRIFRLVKLPQIRPITVVVVTMAVINSFTTFDYVYVMTSGGPYQSSETLAVTIYRIAFREWQVGYASALAVVLAIITLAFSGVYIFRAMQRSPKEAP